MSEEKVEQNLDLPATKRDLLQFATKRDLLELRQATKRDLLELRQATKRDLLQFAKKTDLEKFATKEDLKKYATREEIQKDLAERFAILLRDLPKVLKEEFATKAEHQALNEKVNSNLSDYADVKQEIRMVKNEITFLDSQYAPKLRGHDIRISRIEYNIAGKY